MRAVILSLDTGAYKAKADVAAAASLKRMLEQVGIEVRAAKAFPEDKEMLKTVLCKLADAGEALSNFAHSIATFVPKPPARHNVTQP